MCRHDLVSFCDCLIRLRQVDIHLVTIEIGVIGWAICVVKPQGLFLWQDSCYMGHHRWLVQSWLSVDNQNIAVGQVTVHNFAAYLNLVGNTVSFLPGHIGKQNLLPSLFVFHNICTRVHIRSVLNETREADCVNCWDTLRESQFPGHKDRHSNLISRNHRIRRNDRSTPKVDSLAHHFHSKHAFFSFEELSDTLLLLINSFLCHRRIHKNIDSILQHDPLLGRVSIDRLSIFFFRRFRVYLLDQWLWERNISLNHFCQHCWMGMKVSSVSVWSLAHVSFGLGAETSGRYNHSWHEKLVAAHRVRIWLTVNVDTTIQ